MEPPYGDNGSTGRRRSQRRMVRVALPQPHQEVTDDRLRDPPEGVDLCRGEIGVVPAKIPPVRRQSVGGQPALDRQVVEVRADRTSDVAAQTSTSSSFSWDRS
jgi:hypothetical protein